MEDKSEELNQLQQARKELKEHLEEEFDPQARMEYQAELDSINEKIDEIYTNDDPEVSTTDIKETDEQNLDDENIVDESALFLNGVHIHNVKSVNFSLIGFVIFTQKLIASAYGYYNSHILNISLKFSLDFL